MFIKSNHRKIGILIIFSIAVIAILFGLTNGVSGATHNFSTKNSSEDINKFFNPISWKNETSPLKAGDTVVFKAGKYKNLDFYINKNKLTIKKKGSGKVEFINSSMYISSNNVKVSGFILKGNLNVFGDKNQITSNNIKGSIGISGEKNTISQNIISQESRVGGKRNIISGNKFLNNLLVSHGYSVSNGVVSPGGFKNQIIKNTIKNGYGIIGYSPYYLDEIKVPQSKDVFKSNKQSFIDLSFSNGKKTSKGMYLTIKNGGTKTSKDCYISLTKLNVISIFILNNGPVVGKVKVPKIKAGKSIKILIPQKIMKKVYYKAEGTDKKLYHGEFNLDYKNKNKDAYRGNNLFLTKFYG
ncbi:hypothetical protein MBCUT_18880 [Methanobrevibacter cuticularis]|uniref:Right handed beta helix domain-containing protein n=1 Tax=Methanobrevibacter cuticularis TaxID=47311 RepID=A0A166CSS2_9EURY|nr:hypothetical protein [Methanobrevibacter cuticularis]KZX14824.1 hypothetical protein MBCUT_18880 [Methanobrevibacter cuticularis]